MIFINPSKNYNSFFLPMTPLLIINTKLLEVSEWLTVNELTLNIKKSNYVIFHPNHKRLIRRFVSKHMILTLTGALSS